MTIISITKNRIIKAIKNEPLLEGGAWVSFTDKMQQKFWSLGYEERTKLRKSILVSSTKDCSVCAVGAVMRNCINPTQNYKFIEKASMKSLDRVKVLNLQDSMSYTPERLVEKGFYMQALSDFFEQTWNSYDGAPRQTYRTKRAVINFVKKNFPYKIKIDIDGAEPAKDVSVVK